VAAAAAAAAAAVVVAAEAAEGRKEKHVRLAQVEFCI
jgi:hypothetical protein